MNEQEKRGPGRPRKATTRQHIDITLSLETIRYIDAESSNRSAFIENCIWEHQRKWEELKQLYPQVPNASQQ